MTGDELVLALTMLRTWGLYRVSDYIQRHHFDVDECFEYLDKELYKSEQEEIQKHLKAAHNRIEASRNFDIYFISMFNPFFPEKLYKDIVPCVYLFYIGDITLLNDNCVAVFGSREIDPAFIDPGKRLIKRLLDKNYTIVTGLSIGCDAFAASTTLELKSKTIAVVPGSVDVVSPIQHQQLSQDIVKAGGLILSEHGVNAVIDKRCFIRRDCILSALCDFGVILNDTVGKTTSIEHLAHNFLSGKKKVYSLKGNRLDYFETIII